MWICLVIVWNTNINLHLFGKLRFWKKHVRENGSSLETTVTNELLLWQMLRINPSTSWFLSKMLIWRIPLYSIFYPFRFYFKRFSRPHRSFIFLKEVLTAFGSWIYKNGKESEMDLIWYTKVSPSMYIFKCVFKMKPVQSYQRKLSQVPDKLKEHPHRLTKGLWLFAAK